MNRNPSDSPRLYGLLAEFRTVPEILHASEAMRDAGYKRWDAHTPFPVHGLNDAMGIRMTRLPLAVLACGLTGGSLAMLMQWWMNAHDYQYQISGKPLFSVPANIPVLFEVTVLLSAVGAFISMLAMNGLPQHHHPLLKTERFLRASQDRFFITVEATDPKFDLERLRAMLERLGSTHIEQVEE
jgi:hypothetical protein